MTKKARMSKRTAEIVEIKGEFTVVIWDGKREVDRFNHLPKRSNAEFHANRWVKEGRRLIGVGSRFKPRTCADKKCKEQFVPKKQHGKYCSKKCGDRVRHERSYKRKVG